MKKKVAAYFLSAVLVFGYFAILWWARTPEVSDVYRMYFIDHSLSVWPGDTGLNCELGITEYLGTHSGEEKMALRLGRGWYDAEDEGRWTKGGEAVLFYDPIPEISRDLIFTYTITNWISDGEIEILANGISLGTLSREMDQPSSLKIPREIIGEDRRLELVFSIERPVRPSDFGSSDARELGVMIDSIQLDEEKAE
ncbi:hypothetical protein [Hominifimenecus sp. rT4P-3]|uniref:hypothetical protein n=1 Tax=Hominifimenecus sp. rT4P-3 TaxID=3242979 RepID=UPI003DA2E4F7